MARKKSIKVAEPTDSELALKMREIRSEIYALESTYKSLSKALLERLVERPRGKQREGIYVVKERKFLKVTDMEKALVWAQEYPAVLDINKSKALKIMQREFSIPNGFKVESTQYLSATSEKEKESEE